VNREARNYPLSFPGLSWPCTSFEPQ